MRTVLACLLLGVLVTAGCAAPQSPSDTTPAPPSQVVVLVSYQRQGGIGGFDDQVVVRSDGSYSLAGTFHSAGTGMLSASELTELHGALDAAGFATLPT